MQIVVSRFSCAAPALVPIDVFVIDAPDTRCCWPNKRQRTQTAQSRLPVLAIHITTGEEEAAHLLLTPERRLPRVIVAQRLDSPCHGHSR